MGEIFAILLAISLVTVIAFGLLSAWMGDLSTRTAHDAASNAVLRQAVHDTASLERTVSEAFDVVWERYSRQDHAVDVEIVPREDGAVEVSARHECARFVAYEGTVGWYACEGDPDPLVAPPGSVRAAFADAATALQGYRGAADTLESREELVFLEAWARVRSPEALPYNGMLEVAPEEGGVVKAQAGYHCIAFSVVGGRIEDYPCPVAGRAAKDALLDEETARRL